MFAKTLALLITKETYPIALACLGTSFMNVPKAEALGSYLVINETGVRTDGSVSLTNTMYEHEEFYKNYHKAMESASEMTFFEVYHV